MKIVAYLTNNLYFQTLARTNSTIPHVRAETPRTVTHNHDEDCDDEDSDGKETNKTDKSSIATEGTASSVESNVDLVQRVS